MTRKSSTRAREQVLNRTPSLTRPGPFSLLLAHTADGDVIVLNLHHAAGDGLSALAAVGFDRSELCRG